MGHPGEANMRFALLALALLLTVSAAPMVAAQPDSCDPEVHPEALQWPQDALPLGPGAVNWVVVRVVLTAGIVTC